MSSLRSVAVGLALTLGASLALRAPAPAGAARLPAASAGAAHAASAGAASAGAARVERYPARLLVYAEEYALTPSRESVPAGPVIVELWNRGMDPHDLRARRLDADGAMVGPAATIRLTVPGQIQTATWRLRRGRYELYCSLPGHMALGMHVVLRVTR